MNCNYYMKLSSLDVQKAYAAEQSALQNMEGAYGLNGLCGIGLLNNLEGMRNVLAPIRGPYNSDTMNAKLAAAKKWLADKSAI